MTEGRDTIEALQSEIAELRAESAVRSVVMRYFALCDRLSPDTPMDELAACFTTNAIWEGRGRYRTAFGRHDGRDAIVAMLASYAGPPAHFAMNAHFLSSETIQVDGDRATGRWMLLQTSTYHDGKSDLRSAALTIHCEPEAGAWRISHFITENVFSRDVDHWSDTAPISVPQRQSQGEVMTSTDLGELVRDDRVLTPIYTDAAIFDEEMDRIFRKTWVWVAHASDIPSANSFKTAFVGREPVIVTRDKAGEVHVLLNRCRHRAASVCEKKSGKSPVFVCPYHGWSYDIDGSLRKVPHAAGYTEPPTADDFSLVRLKVDQYNGMIFATFNEDVEPLEQFLGPARKWIDLFMKQGAGFGVKTLGEHRFRFPGNWKIQLENTTDAYHFPIVHKTFLDSLDEATENVFDVLGQGGWVEDLGNGHSVMVMVPDLIDLEDNLDAPIPDRFAELAAELVADGYPDDQVRRIVRAVGGSGFNLNLFPNVACSMAFFRVLRPIAVDETEIIHVAIGMDGGPEAGNRVRLRLHEHFQGPMGFGTPDDAEGWERVQRGAQAGSDLWIMLNRGVEAPEGKPEPGHNAGDVSAETGMRAAYQMWKRMMSA